MHGPDHVLGALLKAFDDLANFLHRNLRALGQAAHLIGNHGKAAPGFACAGRFDGGIQCQQVGLLGNGADHFKH
ncbi:hypothetical protein D3C79_683160 [compost metagenome]